MNNCPCCSHQMLRHSRNSQIYWYCLHCKREMPNLIDRLKKRTISTSRQGSPALSLHGQRRDESQSYLSGLSCILVL